MEKTRLPALTSLRFVAASMVLGQHYFDWPMGPAGVTFFFALSGFILAYNHPLITPAQGPDFYFKRFARIYPTHLLTFLIFLPLPGTHLHVDAPVLLAKDALRILLNLSLLQTFVPLRTIFLAFNGVSWSISCEAFFYFFFPFLIPRLRARPWRSRIVLTLTPLLIVTTCATFWPLTRWPADDVGSTDWFFYLFPPIRSADFIAGVLLGLAYAERPWPSRPGVAWPLAACLAWIVGIVGAAWLSAFAWFVPFTFSLFHIPASLLTLYVFAPLGRNDGLVGRFLASRPMLKLGETSFMLYMTHMLLLIYANWALSHDAGTPFTFSAFTTPGWRFTVPLAVVAIALSLFGHTFYERPARRWLSAIRNRRRPRPPRGPTAAASPRSRGP